MIRLSTTTTGVQVQFGQSVHVPGTAPGTRIALDDAAAAALHRTLGDYLAGRPQLGQHPCTCSLLAYGTPYRCAMHPSNQALSFDQRMEYEQAHDARVAAGKAKHAQAL